MGLLGDGWDDPRSSAMMALAGGLLQGNFGAGLLGANDAYAQAKQGAAKQKLLDMQMQEHQLRLEDAQRQRAMQQQLDTAARSSFITPEKAQSLSMGPMPGGAEPPTVAPGFNSRAYLDQLYGIDPMRAVQFQQAIAKDESPLTVAPGASLVDRHTMKPIFTAPKQEESPAAIREYQFAVNQGYRGTFDQWDKERKQAGASRVDVRVNAEKSLLNEIAGGLGKSMTSARDNAQAALGTISTVNRLNEALDSGKVMAGPGTSFRQFGLQVGNTLGVGGATAQEKLTNTRQAIQSLAQLELDAAQQMKGQGQITEAERAIIKRAAAGDVDSMTVPELRLLGGILDRSARTKIRSYNTQVLPLKRNPNAAPLAPFLDVPEPPGRPESGGNGWSIREVK